MWLDDELKRFEGNLVAALVALPSGEERVARLMRLAGPRGFYRRGAWGCTKRDPDAVPNPDLVRRQFNVDGPDALWVSDVTEHKTDGGKLYLAVVIDA